MTDKPLLLHLRREWFDQVAAGTKIEEYRENKPYWQKRLVGKEFSHVEIILGYPEGNRGEKICFPWKGYTMKILQHPVFGGSPLEVFAIKLEAE